MKPLLSFFLLLVFAFHAIPATNLIEETCKKFAEDDPNISYNFCVTSLQASPDSRCANVRELGIISIRLTRSNVTDSLRYIKGLLKSKKLNLDVRACLNDCHDLYSDALSSLKQAIKDYKSKKYHDANIQVSSVIDASTTCEDGFKEKGVVSPLPLRRRNKSTFQLSAIALSIINMLR